MTSARVCDDLISAIQTRRKPSKYSKIKSNSETLNMASSGPPKYSSTQLSQLALYQTLDAALSSPDLSNFQTSRLNQSVPVTRSALGRRKVGHHYDVQTGSFPVRISIGDHILIDENLAVAALHSGDDIIQDLLTVRVGPVVENGMHVVSASPYFRC
jgi:hypothetical protein